MPALIGRGKRTLRAAPGVRLHNPRIETAHLASALFPRRAWGKRVSTSGWGIFGFGSKCDIERGITPLPRPNFIIILLDRARACRLSIVSSLHALGRAEDKVIPGKEGQGV
jgi:hypothetical protein